MLCDMTTSYYIVSCRSSRVAVHATTVLCGAEGSASDREPILNVPVELSNRSEPTSLRNNKLGPAWIWGPQDRSNIETETPKDTEPSQNRSDRTKTFPATHGDSGPLSLGNQEGPRAANNRPPSSSI